MRECIDDATLQTYFDGELAGDAAECVASHLSGCGACASALRELETENQFLVEALGTEFAAPVPTESLRERIESAIGDLQPAPVVHPELPSRNWLQSLVEALGLSPQRTFAYAGLAAVVIFAGIVGVMYVKRNQRAPETVLTAKQPVVTATPAPAPTVSPVNSDVNAGSGARDITSPKKPIRKPAPRRPILLPGESNYVQQIATLNAKLKSRKGQPMRPGLQVEYVRNLALVDNAIAATRDAAMKNPNDPNAAQFVLAAYQSKVNLLNQIADARTFNGRE
jgi:anti-sigma factor RsiW